MCKHPYKCFYYTLALSLHFLVFTFNYYWILEMFKCLLFYEIDLVVTNSSLNPMHCTVICIKLFYNSIIFTAYSNSLLHLYIEFYSDFEKTIEKSKNEHSTSLLARVCSLPNIRIFNKYLSV